MSKLIAMAQWSDESDWKGIFDNLFMLKNGRLSGRSFHRTYNRQNLIAYETNPKDLEHYFYSGNWIKRSGIIIFKYKDSERDNGQSRADWEIPF